MFNAFAATCGSRFGLDFPVPFEETNFFSSFSPFHVGIVLLIGIVSTISLILSSSLLSYSDDFHPIELNQD
jgi:hypothetical protein